MKIKATKKILSLVLAVMMVMSTFAMMFVNAEDAPATDAPVTTPKAYASAADGEKLLDVDFSKHWTVVDDSVERYDNDLTYYFANGEVMNPADGKIDKDGNGKVDIYGGIDNATFTTGWNNQNVDTTGAAVMEDDGATLAVRGKKPAVGKEGEEGYVPEVPSDALANDQRLVGQFEMYDLENKTYTYEFDAAWDVTRFKVYFANGTFVNFGGCDPWMPNLGLEINNSAFSFRRNSAAVAQNVVGKPQSVKDENNVYHLGFKIVLAGGEKIEDMTLYNGTWTNPKETLSVKGDFIPVNYSIYQSITKTSDDGTVTVQDIRVSTGLIYQPAKNKLVFGIGEWTAPAANKVYSVSNLAIYKGDTSIPFTFGFTKVYEETGWGSDLTTFDAKGITNPALNFANGYEWTNQGSTVVDEEGVVTINRTDKGATQGAYTPHPFGDEWNQGFYEMELTVNNASRLKLGLLEFADLTRVGFNILPNASNESLKNQTGDPNGYLHADAGNAATLWTSGANSFGKGIVEQSTPALADYVTTIVYDTYKADDASDEDTDPQDPRNVRDYGGNRANVKVVYNCVDYIITLFEKVGGEWVATSAIDYSKAVEQGKILGACIDFQAYNANTNATIKNVRAVKGSSTIHQFNVKVGSYDSGVMYKGYEADFFANLTDNYAAANGLWGSDWGWSADGETIADIEAIYNKFEETMYGPQTIKLVPIVTYDELTEGVAVRGIKVAEGENNTYDVTFVGALAGDIAQYNAVGFEIVKVTDIGGKFITTTEYVESNEVYGSIRANGLVLAASAVGGDYIFTATLAGEKAAEGINVDYIVTPYTIDVDGVKNVAIDSYTFSFIDGEYAPLG